MADAPREKTFLLAEVEEKALTAIARRLPRWVLPDHLTGLGVLAAAGIAAAFVASNDSRGWLWGAVGLLVVHWLGDSLDGTLARVRGTERPNYGYYLDHLVDALATALIGIGLGLSPFMHLGVGLAIVVAYLILSINTYLETHVFDTFTLGYGRVGPTEIRLLLAAITAALALGLAVGTALDVAGLAIAGVMLTALCVRAAHNLRTLAAREPAPSRTPTGAH